MATIDEFLTSLRDEFGEQLAGKKFEVFCKWFLENDPEWSKRIDKVWLWDDYPDKWQRQDLGTDLVFLDKDGLIWAVQAKCYSEHRSTIKKHMDSFLADSGRKQVDKRLWFQTTNKMEAKAVKTLTGQDKPVTVFSLRDFQAAQIDYPSSYSELFQAKVKTKPTPDTHQIEAIEAVQSQLQSLDRGQMIMACGTGKTFTTLWIKEALNAQTTLVLLPSLSLLSQTMREWAWAGNTDFDILNVCSDKSVGKKTEDMDPSDTPFPVTSEVDEIARFIKTPKPKVIFCTYQSSPLIAEAQLDTSVPTFDLTIADEAHRCAGKADAGFATVLNAQKIRSSKRLFTTATPRYFGKAVKDESKVRGVAVVGMNDESVFGPVIHMLSFGEAIRRELLTDYQVVIVCVDEPMVKQWIDDYEIVSTNPDKHTDARTLAAKIGLIKAIKDYDLKRVISFHSRVARAKDFSEELVDVVDLIDPIHRPKGLFLADYVSGEMKAGDRKDKIDRLKVLEGYDRGVLTNARCLAEGVDVPSLDGVAFIDPKGSQVEIIQAVGRAIRKVRGIKIQTKGTIVIPVFVEDGDDPEESIEASNFKPVWEVLKALRAHDEELAVTLDQYRANMGKIRPYSPKDISDKIILDLPMAVDVGFSNALSTFLVEATTASWEFWFGLLEQYLEAHGNCNPSHDYKTTSGYLLGVWVVNQRRPTPPLSPNRVERLDKLGFVWDTKEYFWEQGFQDLVDYKNQYGNSIESGNDFKRQSGKSIAGWVSYQRRHKEHLSPDKVKRLDDVGFVWDMPSFLWEQGFAELVAYKNKYGDCLVSKNFRLKSDYQLNNWVTNQRVTKDSLSSDKVKRLDELEFVWDVKEYFWERGFEELVNYKNEHGNCIVDNLFKTQSSYQLGSWVGAQRTNKQLSSGCVKRLDELGFIWDERQRRWDQGLEELIDFKNHNGNCSVNANFKTKSGYNLGNWVGSQRSKKSSLSLDKLQRLNELGFVWDQRQQLWEQGFEELVAYKYKYGDCIVLNGFKAQAGYELGNWVKWQRAKRSSLSLDKIKRLDELGFVWDPREQLWEQGFEQLAEYKKQHGNCEVKSRFVSLDGYALGSWVSVVRKSKEALSSDRFKRLDELGFVWDPK